jgi:5'-deoxynucleotidase YfbR-like HD superfamily hydrolase
MSNSKKSKYQADLRDYLSKQQLVHKVCADIDKLSTLSDELDALSVTRLKAASDLRLALIKKYLPDVKQLEIGGIDGEAIDARWTISIVNPDIAK